MSWKWRTRPPSVITAWPGSEVEIVLDIEGEAPGPEIRWDGSRLEPGVKLHVDSRDPRRGKVEIPLHHIGVCRVAYRVEGNPPALGMIHVQVLPTAEATAAMLTRESSTGVKGSVVVHESPKVPIVSVLAEGSGNRPTGMDKSSGHDALEFCGKNSADWAGVGKNPERGREERELALKPPMLSEVYVVEVWKDGQQLPGFTSPVLMHRTLTVGRYSLTQQHRPDIDLSRQFDSDEDESLCARRQAEIFWSKGRLILRNTGANPLQQILPDGSCCDIPDTHVWRVGESIVVPGGLVLQLVKQAS